MRFEGGGVDEMGVVRWKSRVQVRILGPEFLDNADEDSEVSPPYLGCAVFCVLLG